MLRSPFFCFIISLLLFSCAKETPIDPNQKPVKKEAVSLREAGTLNLEKKNFNVAFYNFNKSKIIFEKIKDSANIVYNLIQMASIQQINGDYYGSKETLTEALPYIKKKNVYSASINNYFGIADKELSIYSDAIYYYKEAIKDCTDSISKQSPLNNIAVVKIAQKKYDDAISILESILSKKVLTDIQSKARVTDNLGYAYFKKGMIKKGLLLMNEGFIIRNEADDIYGSIKSNLHLAEYYTITDSKKSGKYALDAYNTATKLNSIDERLKALQFLISNGPGDQNIKYAQKYITLNDSIIRIRNNYKNKFAKIKYDSKKEKDENQKLRLERAENMSALHKAQFQQLLFITAFIFVSGLLFYLRKYYQNKNRIEKLEASYDTETRISKKIHDELANDVFHAITFAETQLPSKENTKENLLQKLDDIYVRVRGISRENNDIDTGENFSRNIREMLSTYNNSSRNVIVHNLEKINWEAVDEIKKITISRILQELMVNMKKHSEAKTIVVKFENNQKSIAIDYSDNGKGCAKNEIIKNGLQNMENRILAIKGTITFDTEPQKGFKVKIAIPK